MKLSDIQVHQKIYIENAAPLNPVTYLPSRIEELSADHMVIASPIKNGAIVPLHVGENITLKFMLKNSFFGFSGEIVARQWDPIPTVTVKLASDEILPAEQRRQHVRVDVRLSFNLAPLEGFTHLESIEFYSNDISSGGIAFYSSSRHFYLNQLVHITLPLPKANISAECLIVRSLEERVNDGTRYRIALQFIQIDEKERDKIAFFVFEKQREYLKRGLEI